MLFRYFDKLKFRFLHNKSGSYIHSDERILSIQGRIKNDSVGQ